MSQEVRGRVQGRSSPRTEDWHEPEPAAEDQPEPDRLPDGHPPGSPVGMTSGDVEGRARLATHLPYRAFPANRAGLLVAAREHHAPDDLAGELERLPADRTYQNVNEVWEALGHGTEDESHRA